MARDDWSPRFNVIRPIDNDFVLVFTRLPYPAPLGLIRSDVGAVADLGRGNYRGWTRRDSRSVHGGIRGIWSGDRAVD